MFEAIHLVRLADAGAGGAPPLEWLDTLALNLARSFHVSCRVREEIVDIAAMRDRTRGQYHSTPALRRLLDLDAPAVLGVTRLDLFVPVLTFVFGEAQLVGRAAVVSTCRLDDEFYGLPPNRPLLLDRLLKEAVHELGHTRGLRHCMDWSCAMSSAHAVERLDLKQAAYCSECQARLTALLA